MQHALCVMASNIQTLFFCFGGGASIALPVSISLAIFLTIAFSSSPSYCSCSFFRQRSARGKNQFSFIHMSTSWQAPSIISDRLSVSSLCVHRRPIESKSATPFSNCSPSISVALLPGCEFMVQLYNYILLPFAVVAQGSASMPRQIASTFFFFFFKRSRAKEKNKKIQRRRIERK